MCFNISTLLKLLLLLKLIGSMFTRLLHCSGFDNAFVSFWPCVLVPVGKKILIYCLEVGL